MEVQNPLRSLAPAVDADVLFALHGTHVPLTGERVAKLAGRSGTQVRQVLRRLSAEGLVLAEPVGRATTYALNREHVLAPVVDAAVRAPGATESRIAERFAAWPVPPIAAAVFGSFARRDGDAGSDLDLFLVRPDDVLDDDEAWAICRHDLAVSAEAWSGNRVQVLELSAAELTAAVEADEPLVESLRHDARWLCGDAPGGLRPVEQHR